MIKKINLPSSIKKDAFWVSPQIITVNDFNEASLEKFRNDFENATSNDQTLIPIHIDSYGGEVYALLGMIDILQASTATIATIMSGKAMSCGAVLFSCGHEGYRFIAPNSTMMIHDVSSFSVGKVKDIASDAVETSRINERIFKLMAKNCGHDVNYFLDIVYQKGHADWYLDSKEAIKHNLANNVGLPTFTVSVNVDYSLTIPVKKKSR